MAHLLQERNIMVGNGITPVGTVLIMDVNNWNWNTNFTTSLMCVLLSSLFCRWGYGSTVKLIQGHTESDRFGVLKQLGTSLMEESPSDYAWAETWIIRELYLGEAVRQKPFRWENMPKHIEATAWHVCVRLPFQAHGSAGCRMD